MPKTKPLPDLCQYDKAECAPKLRKSKDKRHWCKGKVGVKHKVKWVDKSYYMQFTAPITRTWKELCCVTCGKSLAMFWGLHRNNEESDAVFKERLAKAWSNKQADAKRRLAYYLEFVD